MGERLSLLDRMIRRRNRQGDDCMAAEDARLSNERKNREDSRADFLRRFFAVAVSVGFASQLKDAFGFILAGARPGSGNATHAFLLVFAMVVVLGSWEFYFRAISRNPLNDFSRFFVDICIVSLYVLMMLESSSPSVFCNLLVLIMILYVIWDLLRVWNDPLKYDKSNRSRILKIVRLYTRPLRLSDDDEERRDGPFITAWWLIVMLGVVAAYRFCPTSSVLQLPVLMVTYILYRIDQAQHHLLVRRGFETISVASLLILTLTMLPFPLN